MKIVITERNVSIYKGRRVYDKEILNYVGYEVYYALWKDCPSLYSKILDDSYQEISAIQEVALIRCNYLLSPHEIKYCIVRSIATGKITHSVRSLLLKCPKKIYIPPSNCQFAIWFFLIFIVVALIFWYLYLTGLFRTLFKSDCYWRARGYC